LLYCYIKKEEISKKEKEEKKKFHQKWNCIDWLEHF